ncbi:MAG: sigma-54-dependent transcriptional regulator [Acidiferrobacter sp.]
MKNTILIVDDEVNMQTLMRMILEGAGYAVITSDRGEAALPHLQNLAIDVILSDLRMPGMGGEEFIRRARVERPDVPVIVITAHGTISSAVSSIHAGAADYLTKPFEPEALEIAVHNALKLRRILQENQRLKADAQHHARHHSLVGDSAALKRLKTEIARVASVKTNILITGESGTGKELVARAIHESGSRRDHPWVAINCSAIPHELLESELFGFVKGAFSGATQNRTGRIEQAQGGTLFLDEIGDLNVELQAKLLRVIQEREFSPLGSNQIRAVDVRIITATNRDLRALVEAGRFREDLFYRLDVYNIQVPPLRARAADIPLLAATFLKELAPDMGASAHGFTEEAQAALTQYAWPGNIRELRNAVERALLTATGPLVQQDDLPGSLFHVRATAHTDTRSFDGPNGHLDNWLGQLERDAILEALKACDGVQARAAEALGIAERSLWHRIKKYAIRLQRTPH